MKFELEKESKWNSIREEMDVTYWIKVDGRYLELCRNVEDAMKKWDILKERYRPQTKEIVGVIEVDEEAILPIQEVLKTEEVYGG